MRLDSGAGDHSLGHVKVSYPATGMVANRCTVKSENRASLYAFATGEVP